MSRPVTKRAARPAALKRRVAPSDSILRTPRFRTDLQASDLDTPDMAASFLQYCAMCEKQIMTPCNSILYCSEACRRKDSVKPLSGISPTQAPTSPPLSSPHCSPSTRTETSISPPSIPCIRIPANLHNARADLDPTEWKPKPRLHRRGESEAYRYLSQFHRSTTALFDVNHELIQRPLLIHADTTSTTPSLANTPTTTSSSWSVGGEVYDFNTRPLQPRHNPDYYSANASYAKGTDLVTPHVAPRIEMATSAPAHANGAVWRRKVVLPSSSASGGRSELGFALGQCDDQLQRF